MFSKANGIVTVGIIILQRSSTLDFLQVLHPSSATGTTGHIYKQKEHAMYTSDLKVSRKQAVGNSNVQSTLHKSCPSLKAPNPRGFVVSAVVRVVSGSWRQPPFAGVCCISRNECINLHIAWSFCGSGSSRHHLDIKQVRARQCQETKFI